MSAAYRYTQGDQEDGQLYNVNATKPHGIHGYDNRAMDNYSATQLQDHNISRDGLERLEYSPRSHRYEKRAVNGTQPTAQPRVMPTQKAYMPRSKSQPNFSDDSSDYYGSSGAQRYTHRHYSPQAYHKDSISTVDSLVSNQPIPSSRQYLDVRKQPLNDQTSSHPDTDSGIISTRRYSPSISSRDADLESIASARSRGSSSVMSSVYDHDRYNGELYRPVAAPRKINSEVRKMFGEKHPRLLKPEELPMESTDESDSASIASSTTPIARRRTTSVGRRGGVTFIEDDAIREENRHLKSILKPEGHISTQHKVVRFEHVDKGTLRKIDTVSNYDSIDSDPTHFKKSTDIWSHVKPSTGSLKREKKRTSSQRSRRSTSSQRRAKRSSSVTSQSSVKSNSSRRSSSKERTPQEPKDPKPEQPSVVTSQVTIQMEEPATKSYLQEMRGHSGCLSDKEKFCKMCLIIGIPILLLIVVGAVLGGYFGGGGGKN